MEDIKCEVYECLLNRYGYCQCNSRNCGKCEGKVAPEGSTDARN